MSTTKDKSKAQENCVAKEVGGRTVVASGALWGAKADVRSDTFLIECKTTHKEGYTFNYRTWEKIRHEALSDGFRLPAMCIDLLDGKKRLAVVEYTYSEDFVQFLRDNNYLSDVLRKVATKKSSKLIKYTDEVWMLTFSGKRLFSTLHDDIDLVFAPWEYFLEFRNDA